jgi:hypothetical protein
MRANCVSSGNQVPEVPRYYLHIRRGRAAAEAARPCREIAKADALTGNPSASLVIVVADQQWFPVLEVPVL